VLTTAIGQIEEPFGQGWAQIAELGIALVLSASIGLERELRQKAAGLRTYTTVGVGAALWMLVSKYGFFDVVAAGTVSLDPSRVAAQIVSGLGFIGAGVIFVHRGSIQGLTTAATIWLTAAVGAAAAAGLPVLAAVATAAYFLVAYAVRPLVGRLPELRTAPIGYRITYLQGSGLLRELLKLSTHSGFAVSELRTLTAWQAGSEDAPDSAEGLRPLPRRDGDAADGEREGAGGDVIAEILLEVRGRGDPDLLAAELAGVSGVLACRRVGSKDD
jgi:putative Mg2+ transporter-C (MgtC) family protein